MALRYLAGRMRVPDSAALRRVEGSRRVACGSSQIRGNLAEYGQAGRFQLSYPCIALCSACLLRNSVQKCKVRYAKEGIVATSRGKVPSATEEACSIEELKRLQDNNAALIRQIREASSYRQSDYSLVLYFSGGTILGLFIVSLMLRYERRSGGNIGKMMCGIPTK